MGEVGGVGRNLCVKQGMTYHCGSRWVEVILTDIAEPWAYGAGLCLRLNSLLACSEVVNPCFSLLRLGRKHLADYRPTLPRKKSAIVEESIFRQPRSFARVSRLLERHNNLPAAWSPVKTPNIPR